LGNKYFKPRPPGGAINNFSVDHEATSNLWVMKNISVFHEESMDHEAVPVGQKEWYRYRYSVITKLLAMSADQDLEQTIEDRQDLDSQNCL
jgi:hypothetical protein